MPQVRLSALSKSLKGLFISMLLIDPNLVAEEETLDQLIQKAEQPLVDYRANYLKAIEKARGDARKAGQVEKMSSLVKDIEEFSAGGWPDGIGVNGDLEKIFILKYRSVYSEVYVRLRVIASKFEKGEVDSKVKERLEFWKNPMTKVYESKTLVTVHWNIARDPVAAGFLGQSSDGKRESLKQLLSNVGIDFPEGTSAMVSRNVLLVTNTWAEILKIENLLNNWDLVK